MGCPAQTSLVLHLLPAHPSTCWRSWGKMTAGGKPRCQLPSPRTSRGPQPCPVPLARHGGFCWALCQRVPAASCLWYQQSLPGGWVGVRFMLQGNSGKLESFFLFVSFFFFLFATKLLKVHWGPLMFACRRSTRLRAEAAGASLGTPGFACFGRSKVRAPECFGVQKSSCYPRKMWESLVP